MLTRRGRLPVIGKVAAWVAPKKIIDLIRGRLVKERGFLQQPAGHNYS